MKKFFMAISTVILFSCASAPTKPEWVRNLPQAPDGVNYNYIIGTASGSTIEEATEKSKEDAYNRVATLRGGMDLRKTAGVKYGVRCEYVVKENTYKYNVYVLLKYQIASAMSGAKDDYNKPDGLECETQIIESKIGEKDKEIGDKLRQQKAKIEDLEAIAKTFASIGNFKHKNKAWFEGKKLYDEISKLQVELQNLGASGDLASIIKIYSDMRDNCIAHSKTVKLHWNSEQETSCSEIFFSKLSGSVKMEKSNCSDGLKLSFTCVEKCQSVSYGVECSFEPSLAIESCGGERYSLLRAKEPVTGLDMNNAGRAKETLIENLHKAAFFNEWEKEIKEWVPQCVE